MANTPVPMMRPMTRSVVVVLATAEGQCELLEESGAPKRLTFPNAALDLQQMLELV